ncbi:MAG: carbohydrate kinase family protein [Microbacteriaceae bacterium]|nr:carbohydrate kinase family protein [Microbacteriaceae bacterium]
MIDTFTVAGHLCVDLAPELPAELELTPGALQNIGPMRMVVGGSVANTGKVLHSLGAKVKANAVVGKDELGTITKKLLSDVGIGVESIIETSETTSSYSVVVEPKGIDRTFWHHVGANNLFNASHIDTSSKIVHLGYLPLLPAVFENNGEGFRQIIQKVKDAGSILSIDLAVVDTNSAAGKVDWETVFYENAPDIDILTPSFDDLKSAFQIAEDYSKESLEMLAERLIEWGVGIVAISAGEHGMIVKAASESRLQNSPLSQVINVTDWANITHFQKTLVAGTPVSTNGAGDASSAGFLFALGRGANPIQAATTAAAASATVIAGSKATIAELTKIAPELSNLLGS